MRFGLIQKWGSHVVFDAAVDAEATVQMMSWSFTKHTEPFQPS